MTNKLVNSDLVDEAYNWLCQKRKHFSVNSDVWNVRFHLKAVKAKLVDKLTSVTFNFKPLQKVTKSTGEVIHV